MHTEATLLYGCILASYYVRECQSWFGRRYWQRSEGIEIALELLVCVTACRKCEAAANVVSVQIESNATRVIINGAGMSALHACWETNAEATLDTRAKSTTGLSSQYIYKINIPSWSNVVDLLMEFTCCYITKSRGCNETTSEGCKYETKRHLWWSNALRVSQCAHFMQQILSLTYFWCSCPL